MQCLGPEHPLSFPPAAINVICDAHFTLAADAHCLPASKFQNNVNVPSMLFMSPPVLYKQIYRG